MIWKCPALSCRKNQCLSLGRHTISPWSGACAAGRRGDLHRCRVCHPAKIARCIFQHLCIFLIAHPAQIFSNAACHKFSTIIQMATSGLRAKLLHSARGGAGDDIKRSLLIICATRGQGGFYPPHRFPARLDKASGALVSRLFLQQIASSYRRNFLSS